MDRASPKLSFFIEIGSSAHDQCVNRCIVSRLVHLPRRLLGEFPAGIPASQYWE